MKELFLDYEDSTSLKDLGFYEECLGTYYKALEHSFDDPRNNKEYIFNEGSPINLRIGYYRDNGEIDICKAPTYSQAFKFFRDKHNLLGTIYSNASGYVWEIHDNIGGTHRFDSAYMGDCEDSGMFTTYELAEKSLINKLIEVVKR